MRLRRSDDADRGLELVRRHIHPWMKAFIVCRDTPDAKRAINRIMVNEEFGPQAGRRVVVE